MPEPADPAPRDAAPGFVYDWEAGRKQLEARRRRPAKAGCEDGRRHSEHDECYPTRTPLAARGSATGPEGADWIDLSLDIGTDDGVSPQHRAALLDDHGSPITSFERVEQIAARRCRVRLPGSEIARHVALHLVVMTDPPRR
jgi:hypothetical protein